MARPKKKLWSDDFANELGERLNKRKYTKRNRTQMEKYVDEGKVKDPSDEYLHKVLEEYEFCKEPHRIKFEYVEDYIDVWTRKEFVTMMSIPPKLYRLLVAKRNLPTVTRIGEYPFFTPEAIDEWIEANITYPPGWVHEDGRVEPG